MGRRILTDEQIDRVAAMRERGLSYAQISRIMASQGVEVGVSTIQWQCFRVGAYPPPSAFSGTAGKARTYERNGKAVLPFTPEEDARLVHLEAKGLGMTEVARRMGRPRSSCIARLMRLARYEALQEAA